MDLQKKKKKKKRRGDYLRIGSGMSVLTLIYPRILGRVMPLCPWYLPLLSL